MQFLPEDHPLCQRTQARHFNGKVESGQFPIQMTPMDLYKKWTEGPIIDPQSHSLQAIKTMTSKIKDEVL